MVWLLSTIDRIWRQGHPRLANLLEDALSCAIVPRRHDPAVSPPNIEDPTHGLQRSNPKRATCRAKSNEPSERQLKNSYAEHVYQ